MMLEKIMRDISIQYNKLMHEAQQEFKREKCVLCGKETTSFCNSHSVPKFILKNISNKGNVFNSFCFDDISIKKGESGLNNAGTFKVICRECDSKLFQSYENEEYLLQAPTNKMLREIQLKTVLQCYETKGCHRIFYIKLRRLINNYINDLVCKYHPVERELLQCNPEYIFNIKKLNEIELLIKQNELDEKELIEKLDAYFKQSDYDFNILFWHTLDYRVPIACQSYIALHGDLKGNLINDVYDYSDELKIEELYIVVFPLKNNSVIGLFYPKENHKLDVFAKQFSEKSFFEQLYIINFIIFLYTEDFYLSPDIEKMVLENSNCKKLKNDLMNITILKSKEKELKNESEIKNNVEKLKRMKPKIPFILSKKFKL